MAAYLPIELVGEIWRVAAELFIETEHRTVLNIAAACTIGYHAAIPVIYRTLLMTHDGAELVMRIFNTDFISGSPTLSASPAQRLCPLVRRLCAFKVPDGLNTDDLKYLTGLEMIWDSLDSFLLAPLAPTLTHLFVYTTNWPQWIPSTLTHVSIYCFFGSDWEVRRNKLRAYTVDTLPEGITHFALSFCYPLAQELAAELDVLMQFILARKSIKIFCIWLFGDAIEDLNYRQLLCAIATLHVDDRRRIQIWRDTRIFPAGSREIKLAAEMDAVAGRTIWTEARPVTQAELTAATSPHA